MENRLVVKGSSKLANTTQVDDLCFRDNGDDQCRWCLQEKTNNKLTFTYEGSPLTTVTLSPDGTVETNADVIVNGSLKPFRYLTLRKTANQTVNATTTFPHVIWETVSASNELSFVTPGTTFDVPQDGIYSFTIDVEWDTNQGEVRSTGIWSGVVDSLSNAPMRGNVGNQAFSGTYFLKKGAQVAVQVNTDTDTQILPNFSRFEITQLR